MEAEVIFVQDNFRVLVREEEFIGKYWSVTDGKNWFSTLEKTELEIDSLHQLMNGYLREKRESDADDFVEPKRST